MQKSPRQILAENLRRLMAARPGLDTFPKITKAGGPTNGTLDRIRRQKSGCSIDQLAPLAQVFELEPWHLLIDGLEPNNPPIVRGTSPEETALWNRIDGLMRELGDLRDFAHSKPRPLD